VPLSGAGLAAAFGGVAPVGRDDGAVLEERLVEVVRAAQAAHPGIALAPEHFVRHLARHRPADAPAAALDAWLASICAGDLYLACACAEGTPAAVEALHRQYRAQVGAHLSGMRPGAAFVEDVAQAVLERLLVGVEGSPPRIVDYSGRGALGSWLRVVTVRLALDLRRRRSEELAHDDGHGAEPAEADGRRSDPEVELLQRRYLGELNAALSAAVGALKGEQRDLLRSHFVEGATLEQLAATRGVHRATVVRWIAAARHEVLAGARRQLGEKLQVRPAELESLMGLMRSRLDLSLSSAFPKG
jgi:RNA polymerase sigma-70 factor (ECF subfamily)